MAVDSLRLQIDIVRALANRDLGERICKSPLGVVGLLIEPLVYVAMFLALRLLVHSRGTPLMDPVLQLSSGFILFFLFSKIAIKSIGGVVRSRHFAELRRIRPLDVLIAGALVEIQIYGACIVLVILAVSSYQWAIPVADPGAAVALFILVALASLGIGLTALVVGYRVPVVKVLIDTIVKRLLFWTSGLFFSIATIPDFVRPFLLWNPLLHGIELFRHALQPAYPIPGVSLEYLLLWVFGSLGLSMLVYGNNEELLNASEAGQG